MQDSRPSPARREGDVGPGLAPARPPRGAALQSDWDTIQYFRSIGFCALWWECYNHWNARRSECAEVLGDADAEAAGCDPLARVRSVGRQIRLRTRE
jgi:hypothetical protein